MATAFTADGADITAEIGADERALLLALLQDLADLLEPATIADPLGLGLLESAAISADPVLARILPNAYSGDDVASVEFRRLTETGLRTRKVEALQTMAQTLRTTEDDLRLAADEANAWLTGLNDLRLAIGTRLGLGADVEVEALPEAVSALYDWLTWMQDCLIAAIGDLADTLAP